MIKLVFSTYIIVYLFVSTVNSFCTNMDDSVAYASYEEVKDLPNHLEKFLIDVRDPEELKQTGRIPLSINIPLASLYEELTLESAKESFEMKYGRKFPGKDDYIIFSCRSGRRSQIALELACNLGFTRVKNYKGSWLEWAEKEQLNV